MTIITRCFFFSDFIKMFLTVFIQASRKGKEQNKLTPFNVSLALAISSIKRLQENVSNLLITR